VQSCEVSLNFIILTLKRNPANLHQTFANEFTWRYLVSVGLLLSQFELFCIRFNNFDHSLIELTLMSSLQLLIIVPIIKFQHHFSFKSRICIHYEDQTLEVKLYSSQKCLHITVDTVMRKSF